MKRTLYLHVGVHRTATSAIQRFLLKNSANLQERGFFHPYRVPRHFLLMNNIFSKEISVQAAAADIAARADSKKHPVHSITISDEDICMRRDLSPLAEFRAHFDVKVICFLRRQDLWIESWYQQNVKWQWNKRLAHLTFAEFLAQRGEFFWINYDERLRHLGAVFGAENVICRAFEKGQMPSGPVMAFCDAIGLADRTGLRPDEKVNHSLSPMMTEFMRHLPLDEVPARQRREFERACTFADKAVLERTGPQSSLYMDVPTRAALMAEYAPGNADVARRHFARDQLFFDPAPDPAKPLAPQELPTSSQETMQTLVAPFVQALAVLRLRAEQAEAAEKAAENS